MRRVPPSLSLVIVFEVNYVVPSTKVVGQKGMKVSKVCEYSHCDNLEY